MILQICRPMRMLWNLSSVTIRSHFPVISFCPHRVCQIFDIIANRQHYLIRHESMLHQIQYQLVCHFLHNNPCFLSAGYGHCNTCPDPELFACGRYAFDLCNRARFVPPQA